MRYTELLGLASLAVSVHGHPHAAQQQPSVSRRALDISQFRLPGLSSYTNTGSVQSMPASVGLTSGGYVETATRFVRDTLPDLDFRVVGDHYVGKNGIAHVNFKQTVHGLDLDNGDFNVNIARDGTVFSHGNSFFNGELPAQSPLNKRDFLDPAKGLGAAITLLGLPVQAGDVSVEAQEAIEQYIIRGTSGAESDPEARLVYFNKGEEGLVLTWRIETDIFDHWLLTYVDAASGEQVHGVVDYGKDLTYEVYPWGVNDPSEGERVVVEDPWLAAASEFTWVGDGTENYTTTQGNNAVAVHNPGGSDSEWDDKYRPDDPELTFEYPLSLNSSDHESYKDASIAQLFYTSNKFHDLLYVLGFTEEAGNFELNNNGQGGLGNDFVILNSQDGRMNNNAMFFPPPDGRNGRMLMFMWDQTTPMRDSSFDAGVVIHEYTHGLSTRLTGGPENAGCLDNREGGGMGEGWSDIMATIVRLKSDDTRETNYVIANWLTGDDKGLRPYPYSTNMETNPQTYSDINGQTTPHGIGAIWATVLYDLLWNLIDKHGKNDADLPEFDENGVSTDGKYLTMQLLMDGMALQPCSPTLVSARDAILDADEALTGGSNTCEIWSAFAKRGLGQGAETADEAVDDFTLPEGC